MRNFFSFTLLVMLLSVFAVSTAGAQKTDNVRSRLKWDRPSAPSNAEGEIEKVYFGYTRPDGKHFNLVAELPFPVASDQFKGGDIKEPDINFDGIPDLMISLGSLNGIGDFIYEGYVWDSQTHRFRLIKHFRDIINPEIEPEKNRIMSYDRHDDVIEVSEWSWKVGVLMKTGFRIENAKE